MVYHFQFKPTLQIKKIRFFFPVGVRLFTVMEGLCFSILDFYEDAFENSQSVKDQLCRIVYEGGCRGKTYPPIEQTTNR